MIFVSPPVFLYVGGLLAAVLPDHWGWHLFLGCHLAATLAMPFVLAHYYFVTLRGGNAAALLYMVALVTAYLA